MPLAANTANVAILHEDSNHARVSMWLYQNTAGDESDVLKVNTATLTSRLVTLNFTAAAKNYLQGEQVSGNTSAAVGFVRDYQQLTGKLNVVMSSGVFQNGDLVTGATSGETAVINTITTPTYVVDVDSVWYSVLSPALVALEWGNSTPSFASFAMLSGNGFLTKQNLPGRFASSVSGLPNPNGNIYISTYGVGAKGGYHIIIDLHKAAGFSQRPVY